MRTAPRLFALAMSGFVSVSAGSWAQTPPPAPAPLPPEVTKPPGENTTPPADPSTDDAEPTKPLTKKLREGEGVLEPPRGIDPKMEQRPDDAFKSKTPVIPPPGEPGGSQDVQPK